MTRRDYCFVCNEMVNDDDVICVQCGESFCYQHTEGYDSLSRLSKLITYANIDHHNKLTDEEINIFIQDLFSNELQQFLDEEYPMDTKEHKEMYKETIDHFNNEKNKILELFNSKSYKLNEYIMNFLDNYMFLHEGVHYTCKKCVFYENYDKNEFSFY